MLDPAHPERWTLSQHGMYRQWRVSRFRNYWRWMISRGQPAIIREQSGRAALIAMVRAELDEALRPLYRGPWGHLPEHGHPHSRKDTGRSMSLEPWEQQRAKNEFVYSGMSRTGLCVEWLDDEFGGHHDR